MERRQHGLYRRDEPGLAGRRHVVARLRQGSGQPFQAARNVEMRRREILRAGRIVPDHQRQAFLGRRLAAQRGEAGDLGHESLKLARNRNRLAVLDRVDDHRVARPPGLRQGEEGRDQVLCHAALRSLPMRDAALAVADSLDDGNVEREEFRGPGRAVLEMGRDQQHVRLGRADLAAQRLRPGIAGPEHERHDAARLGARDQRVDDARFHAGYRAAMNDHRKARRAGRPAGLAPAPVIRERGERARRRGMIEARPRQRHGRRDRGEVPASAKGGGIGEESGKIGLATGHIIGDQAPRMLRRQVAEGGLTATDADPRRAARAQRFTEPRIDRGKVVRPRRVDDDEAGAFDERRGRRSGGFHISPLQREARALSQPFQPIEPARQDEGDRHDPNPVAARDLPGHRGHGKARPWQRQGEDEQNEPPHDQNRTVMPA